MRYNSQGLKRDIALQITGVSKHQYYYAPIKGKRGRRLSLVTPHVNLGIVENKMVIQQIVQLQEDPDTIYGYDKTTKWLQMRGYVINAKKVYRLMKAHQLLAPPALKQQKTFAKYRKVLPKGPLQLLEMDIKMTWMESVKKYAYTLTLIDTYTRVLLHRVTKYSIKKEDVKNFWDYVIEEYLQRVDYLKQQIYIEVRNDNDKRFSAKMIQDYFHQNYLNQVFTHPYTPQENGHIESFHAILAKHLKRYLFWDINELEQNLSLFYHKYNYIRLHSSIASLAPMDFWKLHEMGLIKKTIDRHNRKIKFKLKIPYQKLINLTGKYKPEGSSLLDFEKIELNLKRVGADNLSQLTV